MGFQVVSFGGEGRGEGGCEQAVGLLPTCLHLQPLALQPRGLSSGGCQGEAPTAASDVFQQEVLKSPTFY